MPRTMPMEAMYIVMPIVIISNYLQQQSLKAVITYSSNYLYQLLIAAIIINVIYQSIVWVANNFKCYIINC